MMRRLALAGLVLAATLTAAPLALAAQDDPVLAVAPSVACGTVTLAATSTAGTYEIAVFSGPNAADADARPEGQFRVAPAAPVTRTFRIGEDAYAGSAFVSWATISGPERDSYVFGAVAVDTDCAPPGQDPAAPPSIAQLCAATGIAEVDNLLDGVARSQLVGELSPLVSLLVPDSDTVELDASVQLADVRQRLNCAPPTSTTEPTATPTATSPPTATLPPPDNDTDGGFDQVGPDDVPSGSIDTGA